MKTCKNKYPEKTLKLTTVIVKSVTSILKSLTLNICIFVVGAVIGYCAFYAKLQEDIMTYDNDEFIEQIEKKVNEMAELDKMHTQNQEDIKELLRKIQINLLTK